MTSSSDISCDAFLPEMSSTTRNYEELPINFDEENAVDISEKGTKLKSSRSKIKRVIRPKRTEEAEIHNTKKITNFPEIKSKSKLASSADNKKKKKIVEVSNKKSLSTKEMIITAISYLNKKNGSSVIAIKKYIIEKFDVSRRRLPIITKLLKTAGEEGWLIQTAGTGAGSGSYFKIVPKINKQKIIKKKNENKQKRQNTKLTEQKLIKKKGLAKSSKVTERRRL